MAPSGVKWKKTLIIDISQCQRDWFIVLLHCNNIVDYNRFTLDTHQQYSRNPELIIVLCNLCWQPSTSSRARILLARERHCKYECNIWHWFGQIYSALVLVRVASTLAIRTRSKLNRCETTSRRWFSLIQFKSLIRISWCSVNARMGAKPVSLRIKSASVNGV